MSLVGDKVDRVAELICTKSGENPEKPVDDRFRDCGSISSPSAG